MSRIYVIHENTTWVEPLREAFDELSLPFEEWFLDTGRLDLSEVPPEGVFYNRMSPPRTRVVTATPRSTREPCWHGSRGMAGG